MRKIHASINFIVFILAVLISYFLGFKLSETKNILLIVFYFSLFLIYINVIGIIFGSKYLKRVFSEGKIRVLRSYFANAFLWLAIGFISGMFNFFGALIIGIFFANLWIFAIMTYMLICSEYPTDTMGYQEMDT